MKVLTPGHRYELANFENKDAAGQVLQFIHKEAANKTGDISLPGPLVTVSDGTTNEEAIAALIDRMQFLQGKFPCRENALVITKLEEALMWLEKRTSDRVKRNVEGKHLA